MKPARLGGLALVWLVVVVASPAFGDGEPKRLPKLERGRLLPVAPVDCCYEVEIVGKTGQIARGSLGLVDLTAITPDVPSFNNQGTACPLEYPQAAATSEIAALLTLSSLAINANFFWWEQGKNFHDLNCERAIGLSMGGGKVISKPGQCINSPPDRCVTTKNNPGVLPDSAIFFDYSRGSKLVQIAYTPDSAFVPPLDAVSAVSGVVIVQGLSNVAQRAKNAEINWDGPEPRTALGFSGDSKTMYVMVIEGGLPDNPGISLPELADYFIAELRTPIVLNLDGGGSTTLTSFDDLYSKTLSAPKDRYPPKSPYPQYRPVPVSLVFQKRASLGARGIKVIGTPIPNGQHLSVSSDSIALEGAFTFLAKPSRGVQDSTATFTATSSVQLRPGTLIQIQAAPDEEDTPSAFTAVVKKR